MDSSVQTVQTQKIPSEVDMRSDRLRPIDISAEDPVVLLDQVADVSDVPPGGVPRIGNGRWQAKPLGVV
jgi:hypothetical protein